ncbi:MAG: cytochrome c [Verrucomicrobiae bacterium]|nr:cytochrome c [Verrucomicrobiae bacterium]
MAENPHPDHDNLDYSHKSEEFDLAEVHQAIDREKNDPVEGNEPIPVWMVALCAFILFCGGLYFGNNTGGFRADVFDSALVTYGPVKGGSKQVDPLVAGKRLFVAQCASCHQSTGQGVSGQYPTLHGTEQVIGAPNRLVALVLHGMNGPINVKGALYNGNMPAHKDKLTDDQLALILTYVRTNPEWGNACAPVTRELVAKVRADTKDRPGAFTWEELLKMPAEDIAPVAQTEAAPAPGTSAKK